MPNRSKDLSPLRREIERVDREIGRNVARRLRLARSIARTKSASGIPLRDYRVEKEVVQRWVDRLDKAGVDPARGEALARWLIEEAIRVQEPIRHPPGRAGSGALDIGIVGGSGAMGQWLGEFFEGAGHRIFVIDPRPAPGGSQTLGSVRAALGQVDVLVFATPIARTASLLESAIAVDSDVLMFDVLSVKAPIEKLLARGVRAGRRLTSVHPMFGPSARTLSGRNLLIVRCGNSRADAAARSLFAGSALSISDVQLGDHDRLMAESLGLSHAVNLLFLGALANSRVSPKQLSRVASTTFHRQSSLALSVAREGVELYLEIQASNPHSRAVYRGLQSRLDELQEIVKRRDLRTFRRWLEDGRAMLESGPSPMRA